MASDPVLFEYLLRLGDNSLILGQRMAEWCGHGPALEEDIALANVGLDLLGQTQMWLGLAAEVEGAGRSADDLAFLRDVWEFRNLLLVERPNGDFAHTTLRAYFFDVFNLALLGELVASCDQRIADIAAKSVKEAAYHVDRTKALVIALGDGTEESHGRMQAALYDLWAYTGEMFAKDKVDDEIFARGVGPDLSAIQLTWQREVHSTLQSATLDMPAIGFAHSGGKTGKMHSEALGHMLATMQWLQRAYPGAQW